MELNILIEASIYFLALINPAVYCFSVSKVE